MGQIHYLCAVADDCVVIDGDITTDDASRTDTALFTNGCAVAEQRIRSYFYIVKNHGVRPNR